LAPPSRSASTPQRAGEPPVDRAANPDPPVGDRTRDGEVPTAAEGDKRHMVQPGESLWKIAADELGSGASTAEVARFVNRLWEINSARIATGDPDLIMPGTVLRLP